MPTLLGHAVVAGAAAEATHALGRRAGLRHVEWTSLLVLLSCLPDADVIMFAWYRYEDPLCHRGISHSIVFALALTALATLRVRAHCRDPQPRRFWLGIWGALAAVMTSHGVLDAFTDGGLGVLLFWPASAARWWIPWAPIPVSPISLHFGPRMQGVMLVELVLLGPLLAAAIVARRATPLRGARHLLALAFLVACGTVWYARCVRYHVREASWPGGFSSPSRASTRGMTSFGIAARSGTGSRTTPPSST